MKRKSIFYVFMLFGLYVLSSCDSIPPDVNIVSPKANQTVNVNSNLTIPFYYTVFDAGTVTEIEAKIYNVKDEVIYTKKYENPEATDGAQYGEDFIVPNANYPTTPKETWKVTVSAKDRQGNSQEKSISFFVNGVI